MTTSKSLPDYVTPQLESGLIAQSLAGGHEDSRPS